MEESLNDQWSSSSGEESTQWGSDDDEFEESKWGSDSSEEESWELLESENNNYMNGRIRLLFI